MRSASSQTSFFFYSVDHIHIRRNTLRIALPIESQFFEEGNAGDILRIDQGHDIQMGILFPNRPYDRLQKFKGIALSLMLRGNSHAQGNAAVFLRIEIRQISHQQIPGTDGIVLFLFVRQKFIISEIVDQCPDGFHRGVLPALKFLTAVVISVSIDSFRIPRPEIAQIQPLGFQKRFYFLPSFWAYYSTKRVYMQQISCYNTQKRPGGVLMELKAFTPADEAVMLEILTNAIIKQTYMLPDFEKKEDAAPLFQRLMELSQDEAHFVRGIRAEGVLVGFLNDVEIKNGTIELGYVIHPPYHGRGYATEALKLAIKELFHRGFREVTAGAFAENPASLRVMEKAGMTRISKTDEIEYRGKVHQCIYYSINAMALVTPTLSEMHFRQSLLTDEATMSYNHAYGGTIAFPKSRWENWYQKWIGAEDPHYFYRYLYSRVLDAYVGDAAYHYEAETGRYLCDLIVYAKYRGHGFGTLGLNLLCESAKANGIEELFDNISLNNPSVRLFLKNGFEEVGCTEEAYIVRRKM